MRKSPVPKSKGGRCRMSDVGCLMSRQSYRFDFSSQEATSTWGPTAQAASKILKSPNFILYRQHDTGETIPSFTPLASLFSFQCCQMTSSATSLFLQLQPAGVAALLQSSREEFGADRGIYEWKMTATDTPCFVLANCHKDAVHIDLLKCR